MSDWSITAEQLKSELGKVILLDVREPEEHEASRIIGKERGEKLIPLGELSLRAESELSKEDDIVIYCAHGIRSMHALMGMKRLGFDKLRSLEGGICAWEELQQQTS